MPAARDLAGLNAWLAQARASGLPRFIALANGIDADRAAVDAALTTTWSNGLAGGHVPRLTLINRQSSGRAKLNLLRRRAPAS